MAANQRPVIELVSDEPSPVSVEVKTLSFLKRLHGKNKTYSEEMARFERAFDARIEVVSAAADQEELNVTEFQHNLGRLVKKDGNG